MIKKRNKETTRTKILKVATKLFAQSGFAGTSVDSIVLAAKVNKRMIYHYFSSKDNLYKIVFANQWQNLSQKMNQVTHDKVMIADTPIALEEILATLFDYMAENPHFTRLMMWEGLEGGKISRSIWNEVTGPLFGAVSQLIEKMKISGEINPKIKSGHLVISFLGAVVHYFAYSGSLGDLIEKKPLSPEALRERREQLLLVFRQLRNFSPTQ